MDSPPASSPPQSPSASFWARPTAESPALRGLSGFNNLLLPPLATLMLIEAIAGDEAAQSVHSAAFMLFFCAVFGAEWLLGLAVSRSKKAYLWNFWLLADLVSSIPFNWIFQAGRFVRFARVTRVLRLGRYRKLSRMARVARFARLRVNLLRAVRAVGMVLALALSGAFALRVAEPAAAQSLLDAMWWAVVTITAVGYGDITPATPTGRLVGMGLILISLAVFGYAAALASSALEQDERLTQQKEILDAIAGSEARLNARLDELEGAG